MTSDERIGRIQALIEEELGSFRAFADLPASELEVMAQRLTRAIAPLVSASDAESGVQKAA